jgi:hypothetical protein
MNTLPESPLQMLTMMASTSTQIDVFSDGVIESVKGGEINPLTVLVQIRAMEKAFERILKETKQNILSESDKYSEKTFEYMGNEMTKAEHGTKYDFSKCGDPDLKMYEDQKAIIDKGIKERQEFLKALKSPLNFIHDLTGEVCILIPPTKTSVSGLNVKIK